MSMTQPLSGDNSVLGIRGIGVDGSGFSNLINETSAVEQRKIPGIARGSGRLE
jgi:hypothetical protein